ncbi:MAG: hypothetical protein ABI183_26935 [Polyangiaceae bacterium]
MQIARVATNAHDSVFARLEENVARFFTKAPWDGGTLEIEKIGVLTCGVQRF